MKMGIGELVASAREQVAMSVEELSQKSGVSVQRINLIESGDSMFSLDDIVKLKRAMNVSLGYLVDDEDFEVIDFENHR